MSSPTNLIPDLNPKALLLEPRSIFNKCIIGKTLKDAPIYCKNAIIEALIAEHGMKSKEEAQDHLEFNIVGAIRNQDPKLSPMIVEIVV